MCIRNWSCRFARLFVHQFSSHRKRHSNNSILKLVWCHHLIKALSITDAHVHISCAALCHELDIFTDYSHKHTYTHSHSFVSFSRNCRSVDWRIIVMVRLDKRRKLYRQKKKMNLSTLCVLPIQINFQAQAKRVLLFKHLYSISGRISPLGNVEIRA